MNLSTKRVLIATATLATALVLAACGAKDGGHDGMPGMDHGASPQTSSTQGFNSADVMFAQMMIPHHQQALEMATLAETRASDPEVKQLAAAIKSAQDPEITTLKGWLTTWGQPLEASMSHGMSGMLTAEDMKNLGAATGADFDKAFATLMIAHHKGAIEMADQEITGGQYPAAIELARSVKTSQGEEVATMEAILKRLG
ncbi:lipoprotein [Actinorhabdospora filicis]|uniref:Lipoprotein n=1 Tax=Actinorhabdospora filicis TaxID=1785913 RepID=A0A9W6WB47_9ACTN|nr:DUF305 domain-containing protein [Actinorhabdospora filicis]GLZ79221.1 lipoprotein [Actinorhabdospora filicis]